MSYIFETIKLGLTNLRLRLLRTILTALGIILGVAAVITMVSLGEGSKQAALTQVDRLGARNIIIRSQKPPEEQKQSQGQQTSWISRYGLTRADVDVVKACFPSQMIVPLKEAGANLRVGALRGASQAYGTTPDFMKVANLKIARGRYLDEVDMSESRSVAVIGDSVAKQYFPLEDPVGKTFQLDTKVLTIIGVLEPVGLAGGSGAALVGRDLNLDIQLPITTARDVFGDSIFKFTSGSFQRSQVEISEIYVVSDSREQVMGDASRVRLALQVRHDGMKDVGMHVPYQLLEAAKRQALTYTLVFGAVASIALLVGGIGIMNIMLATVTERTREIGIRRALGATRKQILWQFLVETSVISTVGGMIGIALGIGGSVFLDWGVPKLPHLPVVGTYFPADAALPTTVTIWSIVLAFCVAVATGLVFGIYPAKRAASQDPIVALRHL